MEREFGEAEVPGSAVEGRCCFTETKFGCSESEKMVGFGWLKPSVGEQITLANQINTQERAQAILIRRRAELHSLSVFELLATAYSPPNSAISSKRYWTTKSAERELRSSLVASAKRAENFRLAYLSCAPY